MSRKSILIFITAAVFAVGVIVYGWIFACGQVDEAVLTEETLAGDRAAADGLTVGFRADSADDLHWVSSFDYSTDETESSFKRGELAEKEDTLIYDDFRFTGWSAAPFVTRLTYDRLEGLQEKGIQTFYDEIQQHVMETGEEETGKVRLQDYLDYYPVSFDFQFGEKSFHSEHALNGLKVYEEKEGFSAESGTAYDDDVDLYVAFNTFFKIPVIENAYQTYRVSKKEKYDKKTALGYETEVDHPLGDGEDFYAFDPILVIQEENIVDGQVWKHPDLSGALSYDADGQSGDDPAGKTAAAYGLKNRMLFVVNNRTAKGASVDVSQISGGFGVYELPIEVTATATVKKGRRSFTVPDPKPLGDALAMVYPLDEEAEYVELSLSGDHRYLAVFSVKDGQCFVEMVDADTWTSNGPMEVFPASENMTYAWGEDETLALTNHQGHIAVLTRTEAEDGSYEILYSGKAENGLDQAFFDAAQARKEHSYARYQCSADAGLAIAAKDGKVALVQNLLTGDPAWGIRNGAVECAVMDRSGLAYRGILKSNIVDLDYDMSEAELRQVRELQDDAAAYMIRPVRNENWCRWETSAGQ